jgi:hypothetical protein
MNLSAIVPNRHSRQRQAALQQIAALGPFIEGSLCPFKRPGCTQPGWHLTFKARGRTRTLYVPMELVATVKQWTRNYRQLKQLIRQVTRHSRALIHSQVANRQAANRSKALTNRAPLKPWCAPSGPPVPDSTAGSTVCPTRVFR